MVHAKMKATGDEFAVKIMEKRFIKKENKVKFVMMERQVFARVNHERVVKLFFTFQDTNYLYMVMELCRGGELLNLIMYVSLYSRDDVGPVDLILGRTIKNTSIGVYATRPAPCR